MSPEEALAITNVFRIEEHFAGGNEELTYYQNKFRDKLQDRKELKGAYNDFSKSIDESFSHLSYEELKEIALFITIDVNEIYKHQKMTYQEDYNMYSVTSKEEDIESLSKSLFGLEIYTGDHINLLDVIIKLPRLLQEESVREEGSRRKALVGQAASSWVKEEVIGREESSKEEVGMEDRAREETPREEESIIFAGADRGRGESQVDTSTPLDVGTSIGDCASFLSGTSGNDGGVEGGDPSPIGTTPVGPGGNVGTGPSGEPVTGSYESGIGLYNLCVSPILTIPGGISDPAPSEEELESPPGTGLDIEDYSVLGEDPLEMEEFMGEAKDFGKKMGQDPALKDSDMEQYFDDQKQGEIKLTPVPKYSGEIPPDTFEKLKKLLDVAKRINDARSGKFNVPVGEGFNIGGDISKKKITFGGPLDTPAPESEDIDDDPCNAALLCMIAMMKQMQQEEEKEEECQGSLDEQEQGIAVPDPSFNDCGGDPASAVPYLGLFTGFTDPSPIQEMSKQKTTQASTPVEYTTFLVIESKKTGFD